MRKGGGGGAGGPGERRPLRGGKLGSWEAGRAAVGAKPPRPGALRRCRRCRRFRNARQAGDGRGPVQAANNGVRGKSFREDAKGRKGLGTSPFGPAGLSTVPIPCGAFVFPSCVLRAAARPQLQPICELPKVFRAKRRNICGFPPPSSQRPAGGSRPLIGFNRRNRRFPAACRCAGVCPRFP